MARALIAIGASLVLAFAVLALVVFATRDEDRLAVDNLLALELTRAIGQAEGAEVDLRLLADFRWDRVLIVAPGTAREVVSEALGSDFRGDLPYGSTGQLLVFADGKALARFADYRGRAAFEGFEHPLDTLPRGRALLRVRDGGVRAKPG